MFCIYLTRFVLPLFFVAGMMALPFFWLPGVEPPEEGGAASPGGPRQTSPANAKSGAPDRRRPTPFQRAMTLGFVLILISVTGGGIMLYGITRRQTAGWRRRFAPKKPKGEARSTPQKSPRKNPPSIPAKSETPPRAPEPAE